MALHLFVFLLVVCLLLALARLGGLCWNPLRPSSPRGGAKRSSLPRMLKPRTPDDCPACRLGSPSSLGGGTVSEPVRPWCEVKSHRGARHSDRDRRLRLSEPAVPLLRQYRRSHSCSRWRWQAWSGRADPDLSVSGLPHHVQCSM